MLAATLMQAQITLDYSIEADGIHYPDYIRNLDLPVPYFWNTIIDYNNHTATVKLYDT